MAVDPATGNVYVVDATNHRINEFSIWGSFLKSWGWGVADGSPKLQTCGPSAVPPTPICQAGIPGGGAGQLGGESAPANARGVAIDASGNLYVYESNACTGGNSCVLNTNRVQKFTSSGEFLLTFGREVNLTRVAERKAQEAGAEPVTVTAAEENLCTAASGDICGPGEQGSGPGEFGTGPLTKIDPIGSFIAFSPGKVEVGGQERVQVFDTGGHYLESISLPGKVVRAMTADQSGNLYVAFAPPGVTGSGGASEPNVAKLNPAGTVECEAESADPRALAVQEPSTAEPSSWLYVESGTQQFGASMHRFGLSCAGGKLPEDKAFAFGIEGLEGNNSTTGIAATTACNSEGTLFFANETNVNTFVRSYYPAPDPNACPPPLNPPTIEAQFAESVSEDSGVVRAVINPHFWSDTTYYLQWGTEPCNTGLQACENVLLSPGVDLEGEQDEGVRTAAVTVPGLQPGTTYYYRFVAESSGSGGNGPTYGIAPPGGEAAADEGLGNSFTTFPPGSPPKTSCPNQDRRTGESGRLSDCRAYEMVSPVDKQGGEIKALINSANDPAALFQGAGDGERMTYSSYRAFGDPESSPYTSQYLAARGGEGWSTSPISPPQEGPRLINVAALESSYKAFNDDLCSGWVMPGFKSVVTADALTEYSNLYRRDNCAPGDGSWEAATRVIPERESSPGVFTPLEAEKFTPSIQGFSQDGSHTVFQAPGHLTSSSANCAPAEQSEENGPCPLQVYDFHEGQLSMVCVLPGGTPVKGSCSVGSPFEPESKYTYNSVYRAVSEDGSRIFWTAARQGPGRLYVRLDDQETIGISTSVDAWFWTAAADGSRVLYNTPEKLNGNLIEYDVETKQKHTIAGEVTGFMGASKDATKVYFVSNQVRSSTPNSHGQTAQVGKPNLYRFDSSTNEYRFIATLAASDASVHSDGIYSPVSSVPKNRSSRVSANGEFAAFTSAAPLTGADNHDALSGEADAEVFLYDAATNSVRCVSCPASGIRPVGRRVEVNLEPTGPWVAAAIPGWTDQTHPSRALADNGSRLFFESTSQLVAGDENGVKDVYEWEPGENQAQCEAEGAELFLEKEGGCLGLISSPQANQDSQFLDAGSSGRDVFFRTASSLVPTDPGLYDVYDAREGGGFAEPPPSPASCESASNSSPCQSPPPAPPTEQPPASATFVGPEGSPQKGCPKGKVRRKGRCVKEHRAQHRKHGHHHRKGSKR